MIAGQLKERALVGVSCCDCIFAVIGPDLYVPSYIAFKLISQCDPRPGCHFEEDQVIWRRADKPLVGVPGQPNILINPFNLP